MKPRARTGLCALLGMTAICVSASGCICMEAQHAIPVCELNDPTLTQGFRDSLIPIDFGLLGQPKPVPRRLAVGDVLSVYIEGVLPSGVTQIPVFQRSETLNQIYYPPEGSIRNPSFGVPLEIVEQGTITLPFIGEFPVVGKTVVEVSSDITKAYVDREILKPGRERTFVALIKEGVRRVTVLREDVASKQPTLLQQQDVTLAKIGNGQVIDLAVYQNDVLHALADSGGLPGVDAVAEVLVIRRQNPKLFKPKPPLAGGDKPVDGPSLAELARGPAVRIPLAVFPGETLQFTPQDVILEDGDIVYIPRREEYFYLAGFEPGRRVPLPRDRDVDILEAISLGAGNFGAPTFVTGSGPGNVVTPSLAVVIRKRPDGSQLLIRVDLHKALCDPSERIIIRPDDVVLLQYRKGEGALNFILNFFTYGWVLGHTF